LLPSYLGDTSSSRLQVSEDVFGWPRELDAALTHANLDLVEQTAVFDAGASHSRGQQVVIGVPHDDSLTSAQRRLLTIRHETLAHRWDRLTRSAAAAEASVPTS
jgi:hypothetical protein